MDYRYEECGLDNVVLMQLKLIEDDMGDEVVHIPYVVSLHNEILRGLVLKASELLPKEVRFIRTHLGLTQAQLAERLGKDAQTIGRWERGEFPMERSADILIRLSAWDYLSVHQEPLERPTVEALSRLSLSSPRQEPLRIDASDPSHYRLVA